MLIKVGGDFFKMTWMKGMHSSEHFLPHKFEIGVMKSFKEIIKAQCFPGVTRSMVSLVSNATLAFLSCLSRAVTLPLNVLRFYQITLLLWSWVSNCISHHNNLGLHSIPSQEAWHYGTCSSDLTYYWMSALTPP